MDGARMGAGARVAVIIVAAVLAGLGPGAAAATAGPTCPNGSVTWTNGGNDGNWFDAANWSNDAVPGAGTTVCITTSVTGGSVHISSGASAAAASVTSAQPIVLSGASTLTLSGDDHNASTLASLTLDGYSTLSGSDAVQIGSSLLWDGAATINDTATLTVASGATMTLDTATDSGTKSASTNIDLDGAASYSGNAEFQFTGTFTVEPKGTLTLDSTAYFGYGGTLDVESTAMVTCETSGTQPVVAGVLNLGTISLDSGCALGLDLGSAGGTDTGAFDVPAGAKLVFGSFGDASPQSTFDPLDVSGAGTVELASGFTTDTLEGTTTIPTGLTLLVDAATVNGSGTIDDDGTTNIDGAADFNGPIVDVPTGGTLELTSPYVMTLGGAVNVSGTLTDTTSAQIDLASATIAIDSGGHLNLDTTAPIDGPTSIVVQSGGALACNATGTEVLDAPFANHGTVTLANTCDLDLNVGSAGMQDTGSFSVPSGATLAFGTFAEASPQTTFAPFDVTGAGTVQFAGNAYATLSFDAPTTIPATITLELDGGETLNGSGPLTVGGPLLWDGGATIAGGLPVTVASTGSLTIDSAVDDGLHVIAGTLTIDGGVAATFSGDGPLNVNAPGELHIAHQASLAIDNFQQLQGDRDGLIVNDGTLDIPPGDGGVFGSVQNAADGAIVNDGELIAPGGTFTEAGRISGNPVSVDYGTLTFTGSGPSSFQLRGDSFLGGSTFPGQFVTVLSDGYVGDADVETTGSLTNGGTITLASATSAQQTVYFQVDPGSTLTNTGTIDVAAQPDGAPTIEVAGATLTNTGTIDVDEPTDLLEGTVTNGGTLDLDAVLTLQRVVFAQQPGGTLGVQLQTPSSGSASLAGTDSSTIALAGTLAPAPVSGATLTPGEAFAVVTSDPGDTSGSFAAIEPPATPNGLDWVDDAGPNGATLTLTGTALVPVQAAESAEEYTTFDQPPAVTVTNAAGPVSGARVTFTAPASGAGGTFAGGATSVSVLSNGQGVATAPAFTANGVAGSYAITASDPVAGATTTLALTNAAGPPPAVGLSTYALSFPAGTVGQPSAPESVTVTNGGVGPLGFTAAPSLSGPQAGDFAVQDGCAGAPLLPGASCTLTVTFTPLGSGAAAASLTLNDNAPGGPQVVSLGNASETTTSTTVPGVGAAASTETVVSTTTTAVAAVVTRTVIATPVLTTTTTASAATSRTSTAPTASLASELGLPAGSACLSGDRLVLHLGAPPGDTLTATAVYLDGRRVRSLSFTGPRRPSTTVTLTSLPSGHFTVRVRDTVRGGQTVSASATYTRCAAPKTKAASRRAAREALTSRRGG